MSTKKAPVSSEQLIKQKQEAEGRLDSLRQQQVDALEEGRDFPHSSEFVMLNERIAALDKAIGRAEAREDQERQRADAAEQADSLQVRSDKITSAEQAYLDAIQKLETHLTATRDVLIKIKDISKDQRDLIAAATRETNIPIFGDGNVSYRISQHICRFLQGVAGHGNYGVLHWPPEGDMPGSMVENERKQISGTVKTARHRLQAQIEELRSLAAGVTNGE